MKSLISITYNEINYNLNVFHTMLTSVFHPQILFGLI